MTVAKDRRTVLCAAFVLVFSAPSIASGETVYVSDEQAHAVHVLSGSPPTLIKSITVGRRPRGMAIDQRGHLYVASGIDNRIDVIDTATNEVIAALPSGPDPECIAISPDGKRIYAANEEDNYASFVDIAGKKVLATIPTGIEPEGIAASPDGKWVVVTSETTNAAHFIDAHSMKPVGDVAVGTRPRVAAFTPDGDQVWVSSEVDGVVAVIDVASRTTLRTLDLKAVAKAGEIAQSQGIIFSRDGRRAFIAMGRGNRVAEVDTQNLDVVRYLPGGARIWNVAMSDNSQRLFTANGLSGDISVIDLTGQQATVNVPVGGKPWGVIVVP